MPDRMPDRMPNGISECMPDDIGWWGSFEESNDLFSSLGWKVVKVVSLKIIQTFNVSTFCLGLFGPRFQEDVEF